jgi:site-specific DNA-adenine methylase
MREQARVMQLMGDTAPADASKPPRWGREATVRPFFGFYGGKWRDAVKHYPSPENETIVEPFAGSAGYALRYYDRKVILCEIDPTLAAVWSYLVRARESEILALPNLEPHQDVDDLPLMPEARWLIGMWLNRGVSTPRKSPSKWMRDGIRPGSFWGDRVRQTIARQLSKIRHWRIYNCSYLEAPLSSAATWFIDPPYQRAGKHYRYSSDAIDYADLAEWCKERQGQVIVCENDGADWLPFRALAHVKTTRARRRSKEVVWIRESQEKQFSE